MAVTGPFIKSVDTAGLRMYRSWYRSGKPPYNTISGERPQLPLHEYTCTLKQSGVYGAGSQAKNTALCTTISSFSAGVQQGINRAYNKLVGKVEEEAMMAVNYAERAQAMKSMTKSLDRMAAAFYLLDKGRRHAAMKKLGMKLSGSRWSRPKDAAGLWLEWHFGWEPLMGDVYNAVKVLSHDSPDDRWPRGSGRSQYVKVQPNSYYKWSQNLEITWRVKMGCNVTVINPRLWQLNQLGLTNPATVAWELIPWSFLVDWFVPVGNFLKSFTDFTGVRIEEPFTTIYGTGNDNQVYRDASGNTGILMSEAYGVKRHNALLGPKIVFQPPSRLSPVRGLTAISLLLTTFGKHLPGR